MNGVRSRAHRRGYLTDDSSRIELAFALSTSERHESKGERDAKRKNSAKCRADYCSGCHLVVVIGG